MSQTSGSKTEKPTPKKIRDARKKGQVVKSTEIVIGAQFIAIVVYFWIFSQDLLQALMASIDTSITLIHQPFPTAMQQLFSLTVDIGKHFMGLLLFFVVTTIIVSSIVQFGFLFAPEAVKPNTEKINPWTNLKNIFSMRSIFELFKSIFKVLLLSAAFVLIFLHFSDEIKSLPRCGVLCGFMLSGQFLLWLLTSLIVAYLIFSVLDYLVQHRITMKKLMMSRKEILDEHKNTEGRPEIKKKRRELHQEIQSGSLAKNVSNATVLIKNPTHIGICIFYRADITPLPLVTEKGINEKAQLMFKFADAHNIPIVENIPVAQKLLKETSVGEFIPESVFVPIAEILKVILAQNEAEAPLGSPPNETEKDALKPAPK